MSVDHSFSSEPTEAEWDLAADWADRVDHLSDAERAELNGWLQASPRHRTAFAAVRRVLLDTALSEAAAKVRESEPAIRFRPRMWVGASGIGLLAAGLAAFAILAPSVLHRNAPKPGPAAAPRPVEYATTLGARSDYALADASVVHMNAASRLSVLYTPADREVRLQQGDAMFDVAKNPQRPFNVRAGDAVVTAVGTSFEVDMVSDAVEVRVFDGAVRVERKADVARQVRKGEWLRLVADHGETTGRFSPQTYQTWRTDWLEADNTPLKYVVARLNRYSAKTIVVKGEGMSGIGVTGRFQLNRTNDALSMISALLGVDTVQNGSEISLSRKAAQDR
jgi:transmembrane sensor